MKKHNATATAVREGPWWVINVDGIGTTQGRTTAEAQRMANDLMAIVLDVPVEDVAVEIEYELPGGLGAKVKRARQKAIAAQKEQEHAAKLSRSVVQDILDAGLSKQDAARILKLSPQRISQLTK